MPQGVMGGAPGIMGAVPLQRGWVGNFQEDRAVRYAPAAIALVSVLVVAASALAWVPKQEIKCERRSGTVFGLVGKNTLGELNVEVADKHLFQGFKGEGKNGENKVEFEIKSAGLGAGWVIEGKNGATIIELKVKNKGPFSKEWTVKGTVGETEINETVTGNWDVDPVIVAALVAFDM